MSWSACDQCKVILMPIINCMGVSIYPVTGCARRLNPYLTQQWQPIKIVLLMPCCQCLFFGAHSRNWIAYTRTLSKWTGKLCRVKINLYNVNIGLSLAHDNYYRLLHNLQKNMKAGILPNICELTTTRIIVRGRIWLRRPMCILHCLVSETFTQGYFIVGPPSTTLGQH